MMGLRKFWRKGRARSRMEIYLSILRAVRRERLAKPTRIMYKSNLSWIALQPILSSLEKNGLIEMIEEDGRKAYRLTDEGAKTIGVLEAAWEVVKRINGVEEWGRSEPS